MPENKKDRLAADFNEMLKIQNRPYLSWIVTKGEIPYAQEYLLTVSVRTYAITLRSHRYTVGATQRCMIKLTLWDSYPVAAPSVRMLDIPPVFHPNWYSHGSYCPSQPWEPDCSLKDYVLRMIGTLCYDPALVELTAPANYKALDWYLKNRDNTALFPSDPSELTENNEEETAAARKAISSFDEIVDEHPFGKSNA